MNSITFQLPYQAKSLAPSRTFSVTLHLSTTLYVASSCQQESKLSSYVGYIDWAPKECRTPL